MKAKKVFLIAIGLSCPWIGSASTDPNAVAVNDAQPMKLEGTLDCEPRKRSTTDFVQVDLVQVDGEKLKVSDPSPELTAFCSSNGAPKKRLMVEGALTSKFLLWGGNLKVTKFSISQN